MNKHIFIFSLFLIVFSSCTKDVEMILDPNHFNVSSLTLNFEDNFTKHFEITEDLQGKCKVSDGPLGNNAVIGFNLKGLDMTDPRPTHIVFKVPDNLELLPNYGANPFDRYEENTAYYQKILPQTGDENTWGIHIVPSSDDWCDVQNKTFPLEIGFVYSECPGVLEWKKIWICFQ